MGEIDLGILARGPHASLIGEMATRCAAAGVLAIWVGGSLAAGEGDAWSDVDFRVAVAPGALETWTHPDWTRYLPVPPCGGTLLRFGTQALLHHLLLVDGTIVDFYVQEPAAELVEPSVVILFCRDAALSARLEGFARPAASLARDAEGEAIRQFLVEYWIATHKELKGLARRHDQSAFAGLYVERMALLRAWHLQAVGKEIDARVTIHMLGALHKGLAGKLSADQRNVLGLPTRNAEETVAAVDAVRAEMAQVGRVLAQRYDFVYPHELEAVVMRVWNEHRARLAQR